MVSMSPRTVKRWCGDSLGALVVFSVVQLLVAPFHYAIESSARFGKFRKCLPETLRNIYQLRSGTEQPAVRIRKKQGGTPDESLLWVLPTGRLPLTSLQTTGILKGARAPLSALLGTFPAREKYPRVRRDRRSPIPPGAGSPTAQSFKGEEIKESRYRLSFFTPAGAPAGKRLSVVV